MVQSEVIMSEIITKEELINIYSKVIIDEVSKKVGDKLPQVIQSLNKTISHEKAQKLVDVTNRK